MIADQKIADHDRDRFLAIGDLIAIFLKNHDLKIVLDVVLKIIYDHFLARKIDQKSQNIRRAEKKLRFEDKL